LFEDYCDDIISRYQLQDLVHHAQVTELTYGNVGDLSGSDIFSLTTSKGLYMAKTVVLAVGPGVKPCIPRDCGLLGQQEGSVCHCFDADGGTHIPSHVKQRILAGLQTNVVVVGGGLTSAQISDLLLRYGVSKVWLLLRGKYKLKHFDVDLEWVSKVRNQQMAVFWSADTDEGEWISRHPNTLGRALSPCNQMK
jgi:thioredoxin reductase